MGLKGATINLTHWIKEKGEGSPMTHPTTQSAWPRGRTKRCDSGIAAGGVTVACRLHQSLEQIKDKKHFADKEDKHLLPQFGVEKGFSR